MSAERDGLRQHFQALREGIPEGRAAAASGIIGGRIEAFCVSRRLRRIGVFWPRPGEVDLRPLIRKRSDWLWYFPRVASTHPPRLAWGTEPLQEGLWGRKEPVLTQHFLPPVDLLLVAGLAFDEAGYRLGEGEGYVNALLERLDAKVQAYGVAFEAQVVGGLPLEPRDLPLSGLFTETRLRRFSAPEDGEV
ncbi:MAG: 5-formyltetrahydrofolate cyclo-ligase [Acidobacteria bacterium]|nr:5-formyltetrahydrofolate cyclo-ligase [Acidobacteriota bacterium]